MKEYQVSNHNLLEFMNEIQSEINDHKLILATTQPAETGKWGMARLWRSWMATTANFMAGNGAKMPLAIKPDGSWYGSRPFNKDDAHELFTREWLGVDENGVRLSWAKSGEQRKATKGERFNALRNHENYCIDRGIVLLKPRGSEYDELTKKQES